MNSDDLPALAANHLGLSRHDILLIARTAPDRYKVFKIPKRSGGDRLIAQPARELKDLQYFLMGRIVSRLPVHPAATAYRTGLSIRDNALPHVQSSALLKMDLTNFFGSIRALDFVRHCEAHGMHLPSRDMEFCCQVLFWRQRKDAPMQLSIGAPSSPMVSNTIVYEMDSLIAAICMTYQVAYTRYADDMTFSSTEPKLLIDIRQSIPRILGKLRYPKLQVNHEKTMLVTKKYRRTVTGLVISNDAAISLGHERKRRIRAMVHAFVRGELDEDDAQVLRGQLAFCKSVEPEFFGRMTAKYGEEVLYRITRQPIRKRRVLRRPHLMSG